jgi:hypothetical protein
MPKTHDTLGDLDNTASFTYPKLCAKTARESIEKMMWSISCGALFNCG